MALFDNFPYTNFHELNLDWILNKMKDLSQEFQDLKDFIEEQGYVEDVQTKQAGTWTSAVTDNVAQIPVSDSGVSGTVTTEEIATIAEGAAPIQHVKVYESGAWTNIVDGSGDAKLHISDGMLPDSGVTADTYGEQPTPNYGCKYYPAHDIQIDATGRVTDISDTNFWIPVIRQTVTAITPGLYHGSVNFHAQNYPWYDNTLFVNINVYEYDTSGKVNVMNQLIPGTDYNVHLYDSGYADVQLTASKTNTVYVVANGCYGYPVM